MLKKSSIGIAILSLWLIIWSGSTSMTIFRFFELKCLDWQFRIRGERDPNPDIVLITIDEDTFRQLKLKYPFPPLVYGNVITRLNKAGALVVAFDLLYSEPTRECDPPHQDEALALILEGSGNVVWGSELEQGVHFVPPLSIIRENLAGTGFLNFPDELDNRIRRFKVRYQGNYSFAAAILQAYAGFLPDHWESDELFLIDFCGPPNTIPHISMAEILSENVDPALVNNKVCLVGPAFLASHDFYPTPFHDPSRSDMAGVELHGQILNSLLSGKQFSHEVPQSVYGILIALFLLICLAMMAGYFWGASLLSLVTLSGWTGYSIYQFHHYTVVPLAVPVFIGFGLYSSLSLYSYFSVRRDKKQIRAMFSSYIDPAIVNYLLKNPEAVNTAGTKITATILYSDIQGFSDISSELPPEVLVSQLNEYFESLTNLVIQHGGMYDKYIGDALMAIFGFPIAQEDQCQRAVLAALDIQKELQEMNRTWKSQNRPEFVTRIGIATGEVVIGSVGGTQRKDFTAYGNVVNTAARLEALNKQTNTAILIDEATAKRLSADIKVNERGFFSLKGIHQDVLVYEPQGKQRSELSPLS